ncbi:ketopantoate reductase family protein [Salinigranum salinum]|uniref:ketopantoate reductase family protein n=1 Tax=Salinigranum salinum TaxID=1364937 RepID=UPI001260BB86|nr:2-dehydropantoate 2-reductase [Salinigranum salinum]
MRVAVYGPGGVGGYVGARLAQAGVDVHLIGRGDHLRALREHGLELRSVAGDAHVDLPATDDPDEVGACDVVLCCVKSFDTADIAARLAPLLGDDGCVVSLQNGVDNEDVLADAVGRDRVLGGVAYIFSTIAEPGVVEHTGGPTKIVFGELDGRRSDRAERLLAACERAPELAVELSEAIEIDIWEKAAFICAQAGLTATTRLPLGDVREIDESWRMYRRVIEEVCAVADARGVDLPGDTVDRWMDFAADLEADSYSSLHYDLTHDKPMELEGLHGAVVRAGDEEKVDVPMTEAIYALLKPWAVRNERLAEEGTK